MFPCNDVPHRQRAPVLAGTPSKTPVSLGDRRVIRGRSRAGVPAMARIASGIRLAVMRRCGSMLGGYDIFKEAKIRRFWAAVPGCWQWLMRASLSRTDPTGFARRRMPLSTSAES
jgi:hypothetical protein